MKRKKDLKKTVNKEGNSFFSNMFPHYGGAISSIVAVFLNLGLWLFMYFNYRADDQKIPLHYDVYKGVSAEAIDFWSKLYFLPILGLLFVVINYILSVVISPKDTLISYFLNLTSIVVQLILFVALFWIFYLQNGLFAL